MQAKRSGYRRRACGARSYPLGIELTAEIQCGDGGWIPEGEIGDSNTPPNAWCMEINIEKLIKAINVRCNSNGIV